MGWYIFDWIVTIVGAVLLLVWAMWFGMRVIKAYALAEGSFWRRLGAALVAVLSASWATVMAPFRALWLAGFKSLTMLWGYVLAGLSVAAAYLDVIGPLVGDPDLKQQITDAVKDNPQLAYYVGGGIAAITIATRARGLIVAWRQSRE